jgi:5-methyltetrahydropteroyltriglutamate--homocysteine methyltransferase
MSIRAILSARDYGRSYDEAGYQRTLREEVAAVVRKQADVGIDIVSDGEYSKAGWIRYVAERLGGFVHREIRAGDHEHNPIYWIREAEKFPEFYGAYTPIQYYDWLPPGESQTSLKADPVAQRKNLLIWECVAPITYKGQAAVGQDIDNFRSALKGVNVEGAFMPVAAPMSARGLWTQCLLQDRRGDRGRARRRTEGGIRGDRQCRIYPSAGRCVLAHEYDRLLATMSEREVHKYAERCVDLTNYGLSGISEERVRYHVCWGSWNAPHTTDVPLRTLSDLILKVRAQAYSLESANPRHEHEWMVWRDVKLPDGKLLIPGVVTHSTNVVEHPELVAWRIKNFASVVGRENVIAGTDCGFAPKATILCDAIPRCSGPSSNRWSPAQGWHPGSYGDRRSVDHRYIATN